MIRVIFYNNRSDRRVLNKNISQVADVSNCELKEDCQILYPSLILARSSCAGYASCNYMYIPTFKRYYHVKFTALAGDMLQVDTIEPDPLMSFANGIRSLYCTIIRQENIYNKFYIDNELPVRQTKKVQWVKVGKYNAGTGIYLTVDGGGGSTT